MAKKSDKQPVTQTPSEKKVADFLEKVNKELKRDIDADKHNREAAIDDLKFLNGDQWDAKTRTDRKNAGRPCLQINLLPQYVDQVVGDIRHNCPRAKIRPEDGKGNIHLARIREGIIASVEHQSNANAIYVEAGEMMVGCGYGAWRVLTRYTEENPFIQEIYYEAIENPFTVYMDCTSKDAIYADAKHGFILEKVARWDFEERYPDAKMPGDDLKPGPGMAQEHWYDKDTITVAEYFVKKTRKVKMCQMSDGSVITKEEADKKIKEWEEKNLELINKVENFSVPETPQSGMAAPQGAGPLPGSGAAMPPEPKIVKERETDVCQVKHYTLTALEILSKNGLEGEDFPGKYVPIILITGKRTNIEGKRHIRGLVRHGKDPQRYVNWTYTSVSEVNALQPKAPFMGTPTQFEGFENDYATANIDNKPFLMYNPDMTAGGLAPPPQRQTPGMGSPGLQAQLGLSMQLLEISMGMQNAAGTEKGPERTGAAVTKKQTAGDIGTFAFIDNLIRGIKHSATITNEMIPEIYDTERDARIRNIDETEAFVPINTTAGNAVDRIQSDPNRYKGMNTTKLVESVQKLGRETKFNDITAGKYSVSISVGPSYATQRSEAAEGLMRLAQAIPKTMALAADLIVKNMDFKDADVLAERLKKTLPQGMVKQNPGEPPPQPLPPPPQMQLMMQKVKLEEEKVKVAQMKTKVEGIKAMKELQGEKSEIRQQILETMAEAHSPKPEGQNA